MGWNKKIYRGLKSHGRMACLASVILTMLLGACGGEETVYRGLHLWITSDAPDSQESIDRLVLIVRDTSENGQPVAFDSASEAEHRKEITLGSEYNIYNAPYKAKLMSGDPIKGSVILVIHGMHGDSMISTWVGTANLDGDSRKDIHLVLVKSGCDEDGDGIMPCAQKPECCEGISADVSDCADDDPSISPMVVLGDCVLCLDPLIPNPDLNCDGDADLCVNEDGDMFADCNPLDCDPTDGTVYSGAPELCDEQDNNCNQQIDEGVQTECKHYDMAQLCEPYFVCGDCPVPVPDEDCGDSVDNDCDGLTNEDCSTEIDWDGDGFVENDCNNYDSKIFEGSEYQGCCDPALTNENLSAQVLLSLCDFDCSEAIETDEWCADGDDDMDGYVDSQECGPGDPTVYPNAPEICGDGKDNDCFGGDKDCDDVIDEDNDGYSPPDDCDDSANGGATIHPGANEVCNGKDDNCNGFIDEGNPEDGVANGWHRCVNPDKPTGVCAEEKNFGYTVCVIVNSGEITPGVQCVDYYVPAQDYESVCEGKDNDCDGDTDEDFELTTLDGKVVKNGIGEACGSGVCAGGITQCNDFADGIICPSESNKSNEVCDGQDNDCDGKTDAADPDSLLTFDLTNCEKQSGVCVGSQKPASLCMNGTWQPCPTAVYSTHSGGTYEAGSESSCDGLDNDCDNDPDDDFSMTTLANVTITGGIAESCGTGLCSGGVTKCNAAGDGIECPTETGAGSKVANEICDNKDNDCDGKIDSADAADLLSHDQQACEKQQGDCAGSTKPVTLCQGGTWKACTHQEYGSQNASYQSVSETSCDAHDNDCDGVVDDDFSVTLLNGQTVSGVGTTCGTGQCKNGVTQCAGLSAIACSTEGQAAQDLCDNVDNDCDGQTDEGLNSFSSDAGNTCNLIKGVCNANTVIAVCANGKYTCDYTTNNPDYEAPEDSCDGKDNDCDGLTDQADASVQPPDICDKDGVCAQLAAATCLGAADWSCVYSDLNQAGQLPIYTSNENKNNGDWCDDKDNDCDGQTDETYAAKGNACSRGVGQCQNTGELECTTDQSGLACSVTGKSSATSCDDGNAQTTNDKCTGGDSSVCEGQTFTCEDDSLTCTTLIYNGDGTCTQQINGGTCLIGGTCYSNTIDNTNPNNQCQWCKNNQTAWENKPGTASCDDGDNCTENDHCSSGTCVAGSTYDCDDDLGCTSDSCGAAFNQCINDLIDDNCLIAGTCYTDDDTHGTNPCLQCDSSESTITWSNVSNGTECIDGKKCSVTSYCQGGSCVVNLPVDCDDGNGCTLDSCSESAVGDGCVSTPEDTGFACEDGNVCTEGDQCDGAGACDSGSLKSCDDGEVCTDDTCDPLLDCQNDVNLSNACSDGDACTENDKCSPGGDCSGTAISCDDSNPCTTDTCDQSQGCQYKNNTDPCNDGVFCNGSDKCGGGSCIVHDGDPCSTGDGDSDCNESCNETSGDCSAPDPDGSTCSDGDSCSVDDSCTAGTCVSGTAWTGCFDGKSCTDDVCVGTGQNPSCDFPVTTGCLIDGVCQAEGASHPTESCQECNGALDDSGWSDSANGTVCDDGLGCTSPDTCNEGACSGVDTCPATEACDLNSGQCVAAKSGFYQNFFVTLAAGGFLINASVNPPLKLERGKSYQFIVLLAAGHVFQIRKANGKAYNNGLSTNNVTTGTIAFTVPQNAPNWLIYRCKNHPGDSGTIQVVG